MLGSPPGPAGFAAAHIQALGAVVLATELAQSWRLPQPPRLGQGPSHTESIDSLLSQAVPRERMGPPERMDGGTDGQTDG